MQSNVVQIKNTDAVQTHFQRFLEESQGRGKDIAEVFVASDEIVNRTYSELWTLSKCSTRGKTSNLSRLYNLKLGYEDTYLLLTVFKYWAKTLAAGSTHSRIGVVCQIISKYGFKIIANSDYLKVIYGTLSVAHKKNLNYLFLVLFDIFLNDDFKEQREWVKGNLPEEIINPHDPVNGAYSDYEFNQKLDVVLAKVAKKRAWWLIPHSSVQNSPKEKYTPGSFKEYSTAILGLLALISGRRVAQFNQCKICDVSLYGEADNKISIDTRLYSIRFFKAKVEYSGFRGSPEGSSFPFSEVFSKIFENYLVDYQTMLKSFCKKFEIEFDQLPWADYPLFPDLNMTTSKEDLLKPSIHTEHLHRGLGSTLNDAVFEITRVRHTVITRGMENGLNDGSLARLTGVTISAIKNYKDLTPESRRLINERFNKNEFLSTAFTWNFREYREHFKVVHTDEFGRGLGGVEKDSACSKCSKKLGAPLGCYACGADLFVPFIEGDHQSQLIKAKGKKQFLELTGANHHQMFEIDLIISRIGLIVEKQQKLKEKALDESHE